MRLMVHFFLHFKVSKAETAIEEECAENVEDPEIESIKNGDDDETGDEADDEEVKEAKEDKDDPDQHISAGKAKKLMNQFNFCERATITYENTLKVKYHFIYFETISAQEVFQ